MPRIKINNKNGLGQIFSSFVTRAKRLQASKAVREEIAEFSVDRMKRMARSGKSISMQASFPGLKEATISFRKSLAKYNKTHSLFKASRSNLTIVGELIDSLKYKITGQKIEIKPTGTHKPYNTRPGKKRGGWDSAKSVANIDIAKRLADQGRVFVGLDSVAKDRIKRIIDKHIKRISKLK